jgi:hypothetical protein
MSLPSRRCAIALGILANFSAKHLASSGSERVGNDTNGVLSSDNEITRPANIATMLQN